MKLKWDQTGEHWYELGADHGILFVQNSDGSYKTGVPWNGLTGVTESPGGAEANDMYADDIKYASIRSAETFSGTIEAYQSPEEFGQCDGAKSPVPGLYLGQQIRTPFAFAYRTKTGNDTATDEDDGYKIHIIYNATASPSEKGYQTINESPEAITFSWELSTTPIPVEGYKPVSTITIDSRKIDPVYQDGCMDEFLNILNGTDSSESRLPLPKEIIDIFSYTILHPTFRLFRESNTNLWGIDRINNIDDIPKGIIVIPNRISDHELTYLGSMSGSPLIYSESLSTSKTIIIENGYTTINGWAFSNASAITKIILPDSITNIKRLAFKESGIKEIVIPRNVTQIADDAFFGCHNLEKARVDSLSMPSFTGLFNGCLNLKEVVLNDKINAIPNGGFGGCSSLKSINLANITVIDLGAFTECTALSFVRLPKVETIKEQAFRGCESLKWIYLSKTLLSIQTEVFYGCTALTDIYYEGTEEEWNAIVPDIYDIGLSGSETIHYNSTGPTN
jgi:hypothetical protein